MSDTNLALFSTKVDLTLLRCTLASRTNLTFVSAKSFLSSWNSAISLDKASTTNSSRLPNLFDITFWSSCNSVTSFFKDFITNSFSKFAFSRIAMAYFALASANCLRSSVNSEISSANLSLTIESIASTICALSCSYLDANSSRSSAVTERRSSAIFLSHAS